VLTFKEKNIINDWSKYINNKKSLKELKGMGREMGKVIGGK